MCGPDGIKGLLQKQMGKGKAVLTSGGIEGGTTGMGATRSLIQSQRRKAAKLPAMPLLGQLGEQVGPIAG